MVGAKSEWPIGFAGDSGPVKNLLGLLVLLFELQLNASILRAQAGAARTATGIQYVSPSGMDSNDGLTPATAKATVNAADIALGTRNGMIVEQGIVTSPSQITLGTRHTLSVHGAIQIFQPILLGDGAVLTCDTARGSPGNQVSNSGIIAKAEMAQMVRGLTQDGTTQMFTIDNCGFDGGYNMIKNGVIDLTGMNDRTRVSNIEIIHYKDGAGVYIGDAPSNSTSFIQIDNVWDSAESQPGHTSSCLVMNATQNGSLQTIAVNNFECGGSAAAYSVLVANTGAGPVNTVRMIMLNNMTFLSGTGTSYIRIDGAWQVSLDHITCVSGDTNCVDVSSNLNNVGIVAHHIFDSTPGGNLIRDGLNGIALPVNGGYTSLSSYTFYNPNSPVATNTYGTTPFYQYMNPLWLRNDVAATSSMVSNPPCLNVQGQYWNGSSSAADRWQVCESIGSGANGASSLRFTHSGTSGASNAAFETNLEITNGSATGVITPPASGFNTIILPSASGTLAIAGANGISAGTITLSSGHGSHTFVTAYSSDPVCTATDTTSSAEVEATSTTTSVSVAGKGSDVIAWVCTPSAN
jgi:hypothetical protein